MTDDGPNKSDLEALKDGATTLIQAGNRVAALALLWSAVAIDPVDLAVHRRLAAALANGGDIDGAASEYARYVEFLLPLGEVARAVSELSYGAATLGSHDALRDAAEKIAAAVRAIVPASDRALPPFAVPRLVPKVPFRFCLHADGERQWMQLEGGTAELAPRAVRVLDREDHTIETRLVLPLAPGDQRHARSVENVAPAVAWVVLGIPSDVASALDVGAASPYGFQAQVGAEWVSLDLVDTGCRLGRARSSRAAS
jgi:hypothetical protein